MGLLNGKTEGGSGGKRGHSNMTHWATTGEIKEATRKRRRLDSKDIVAKELRQLDSDDEATPIRTVLPHDEPDLRRLLESADSGHTR